MAAGSIVFALANPEPEVDPPRHACTQQSSRPAASDEPNQINNVLAFPGVFRGLLDASARDIDLHMEAAAAQALADVLKPSELNPSLICPASSTWTCRKQWRKRYSARSAPNLDQLFASTIAHPRRSTIWASAFGLAGRAG